MAAVQGSPLDHPPAAAAEQGHRTDYMPPLEEGVGTHLRAGTEDMGLGVQLCLLVLFRSLHKKCTAWAQAKGEDLQKQKGRVFQHSWKGKGPVFPCDCLSTSQRLFPQLYR